MHKPSCVAFDDGVPVDRFVWVHESIVFTFPGCNKLIPAAVLYQI